MKKYLLLLAMLAFAFTAQAQVLTKTAIKIPTGNTYYMYTGVTVDTLTTNQDSIVFEFQLQNDWTTKVNLGGVFTKRTGNDTAVIMNIRGKYFATEAYGAILAADTSGNITTTTGTQQSVLCSTAYGYRYYRVCLRIPAQKSTGIKLKSLEIKFVQQ